MSIELIPTRYLIKSEFEGLEIQPVEFVRMKSPFCEGAKWAVRRGSSCLSINGEWDYEPTPSSRTDEFYAEFRFPDLDSAKDTFCRWLRDGNPA